MPREISEVKKKKDSYISHLIVARRTTRLPDFFLIEFFGCT